MSRFPIKSCYLAAPGFEGQLLASLAGETEAYGRLYLNSRDPDPDVVWAHNIWRSPRIEPFVSISQSAKLLKSIQRSWAPYFYENIRRMTLIQEQLPKVHLARMTFPAVAPKPPLGSWTLLTPSQLLFSPDCSAQFPNGELEFEENKIGPPNRAYLKLWEAFAYLGARPGKDDVCLELGASPGGWTWVLGQMAGKVFAVDRAPLDPKVSAMNTVEFVQGNAFTCRPEDFATVTWVISDIICYPEKLLDFIRPWLAAPKIKGMILTIKFQGSESYGILDEFRQIPGSWLRHLRANKHEVTFFFLRPDKSSSDE